MWYRVRRRVAKWRTWGGEKDKSEKEQQSRNICTYITEHARVAGRAFAWVDWKEITESRDDGIEVCALSIPRSIDSRDADPVQMGAGGTARRRAREKELQGWRRRQCGAGRRVTRGEVEEARGRGRRRTVSTRARESERGAAQAEVDGQERFNLLSLSTSACARSLIRLFVRFVQATANAPRTKIGNAAVFSLSRERVQRRRRAARDRNLPNPHRQLQAGWESNATFRVSWPCRAEGGELSSNEMMWPLLAWLDSIFVGRTDKRRWTEL